MDVGDYDAYTIGHISSGGPFRKGHSYKYFRLLKDLYGGTDVKGSIGKDATEDDAACRRIRNGDWERVVFPGDLRRYWKAAVASNTPYVLMAQDIYTMRVGELFNEEKGMIERAAAILFTSEHHRDYCAERYDLPPHTVLHLRPLMDDLGFDPLPKRGDKQLVYVGGIKDWAHRGGAFGYRCYNEILKAFIDAGWEVHVYAPYSLNFPSILDLGVTSHKAVPEGRELYRELSQYTAGLHGYNLEGIPERSAHYALHCIPNKTWTYLAAGIPTIGINSGVSGAMFDGRWGLVKPEDVEIAEWLEGIEDRLPSITEAMRYSQTIDQDAVRVARLLDGILLKGGQHEKREDTSIVGAGPGESPGSEVQKARSLPRTIRGRKRRSLE